MPDRALQLKSTHQKGARGEEMAVEHLLAHGYSIITRNFRSKDGEIDCIAEAPDKTLVFFEVKTAYGLSRGHPAMWITPFKQRRVVNMARRYLADHGITQKACRFDVIVIVGEKIEHIKNAFLA
jgi:putative endonuclease